MHARIWASVRAIHNTTTVLMMRISMNCQMKKIISKFNRPLMAFWESLLYSVHMYMDPTPAIVYSGHPGNQCLSRGISRYSQCGHAVNNAAAGVAPTWSSLLHIHCHGKCSRLAGHGRHPSPLLRSPHLPTDSPVLVPFAPTTSSSLLLPRCSESTTPGRIATSRTPTVAIDQCHRESRAPL